MDEGGKVLEREDLTGTAEGCSGILIWSLPSSPRGFPGDSALLSHSNPAQGDRREWADVKKQRSGVKMTCNWAHGATLAATYKPAYILPVKSRDRTHNDQHRAPTRLKPFISKDLLIALETQSKTHEQFCGRSDVERIREHISPSVYVGAASRRKGLSE